VSQFDEKRERRRQRQEEVAVSLRSRQRRQSRLVSFRYYQTASGLARYRFRSTEPVVERLPERRCCLSRPSQSRLAFDRNQIQTDQTACEETACEDWFERKKAGGQA
jgi:hypothetical protein